MAEELGEELEENYQIEEIEEIIFVANENMKNQSHGCPNRLTWEPWATVPYRTSRDRRSGKPSSKPSRMSAYSADRQDFVGKSAETMSDISITIFIEDGGGFLWVYYSDWIYNYGFL